MKILITSGGTKVPIDAVRHIANMSSGNFGQKIAFECLKRDHEVFFLMAKGSKSPFSKKFDMNVEDEMPFLPREFEKWYNEHFCYLKKYREKQYSTFEDYQTILGESISTWKPDVVVLSAAVSDFGVDNYQNGKIRSGDSMTINLVALPKIISSIKKNFPSVKLVGFKMLVGSKEKQQIDAANKSIADNGCDLVIANDLNDIKANNHKLFLVKPNGLPFRCLTNPNDPNHLAKEVVKAIETL